MEEAFDKQVKEQGNTTKYAIDLNKSSSEGLIIHNISEEQKNAGRKSFSGEGDIVKG